SAGLGQASSDYPPLRFSMSLAGSCFSSDSARHHANSVRIESLLCPDMIFRRDTDSITVTPGLRFSVYTTGPGSDLPVDGVSPSDVRCGNLEARHGAAVDHAQQADGSVAQHKLCLPDRQSYPY